MGSIGGKKSKRTLTTEQAKKMAIAKKEKHAQLEIAKEK
jgi:hypothetical protein